MRIVLLDSDADVANGLEEAITTDLKSAIVDTVDTAEAAIEALTSGDVDCLITVRPPDRPLADFLGAARDVEPMLRVVYLSDATHPEDELKLPDGLDDVRAKATVLARPEYLVNWLATALIGAGGDLTPLPLELRRLLTEQSHPMLIMEPGEGRILGGNDAAITLYGYPRRALCSRSFTELAAASEARVTAVNLEDIGHEGSHQVSVHRRRTGELLTVEVNATPVRIDGRRYLVVVVQDLTKQAAKAAQRVGEDRFERLAEQNIVGAYVVKDRRFSYVNPELAAMFGGVPEAVVGRNVLDFVDETDRNIVLDWLTELDEGGHTSADSTFMTEDIDGERGVIETHGSRVETDEGVAIVGSMLEVSDRGNYQADLRQLSQAAEAAAPAIYITNLEGIIEYVNPAFEELTGYSEAEALGKTPAILQSGRMDEAYYRKLWSALNAGRIWEETIIDRRKNGQLYEAFQTITPYRDDTGELLGYVAIQNDITERRIHEQVLQVFQRIFRHNLRNQLNIITGNAETIQPKLAGSPLERYVEDIIDAAEVLATLSDKATIVSDAIDVADSGGSLTDDVMALLEREKGIISEQYPRATIRIEGPPTIEVAGSGGIEVVLRELLTNAIMHCDRDDPVVEVTVDEDTEMRMASVLIADNGPGLADVELTALQVGEETPVIHGSGIGLWLVEWLITGIGGDVEYENLEPRGLAVRLLLPTPSEG